MKIEKPSKAVVLVGGEGTRLRPLTYSTTKAMVPVLNRPFIEYLICHLRRHDVNEVILAMGYKPDSIKDYFEKTGELSMRLIYSIEQVPLGTAGAVKNAAPYIDKDETLFVLNGDVFTDLDLSDMFSFHRTRGAKVTIALTPVDDPTQFGVVELDSQQRVTRFIEKPGREEVTSNLINAGVYILESDVLDRVPNGKRSMFEHDVFPSIISDREPVYGYPTSAYWIDMGTREKYLRLNYDLLLGRCHLATCMGRSGVKPSQMYPQARITGPVLIDGGCTIGEGVHIKGPSVIGSGCSIGDSALLEASILWTNVRVSERATIKNSVIASDIQIENNAHIENAVVGQDPTSSHLVVVKA